MIVVDAHEDIAYNNLCFGRDYRRSALETRRLEQDSDVPQRNGIATVGLPDALLGRVALTFATISFFTILMIVLLIWIVNLIGFRYCIVL